MVTEYCRNKIVQEAPLRAGVKRAKDKRVRDKIALQVTSADLLLFLSLPFPFPPSSSVSASPFLFLLFLRLSLLSPSPFSVYVSLSLPSPLPVSLSFSLSMSPSYVSLFNLIPSSSFCVFPSLPFMLHVVSPFLSFPSSKCLSLSIPSHPTPFLPIPPPLFFPLPFLCLYLSLPSPHFTPPSSFSYLRFVLRLSSRKSFPKVVFLYRQSCRPGFWFNLNPLYAPISPTLPAPTTPGGGRVGKGMKGGTGEGPRC